MAWRKSSHGSLRALAMACAIAAGLVGCVGDPTLGEDETALEGEAVVPRSVWEDAPAGCEGIDLALVSLARVEDEPLLAALVNGDGSVACVDSLSTLLLELRAERIELSEDPSPQPSDPSDPDVLTDITPVSLDTGGAPPGASSMEDPTSDPTPTPMYPSPESDPTPTPMRGGIGQDPTPTPMMGVGPNGDPTPTPMRGA